jgi:hypothetical protein
MDGLIDEKKKEKAYLEAVGGKQDAPGGNAGVDGGLHAHHHVEHPSRSLVEETD